MTIGRHPTLRCLAALLVWAGTLMGAWAASPQTAFDAANKLFEEGKYPEAAAAYEKLLGEGVRCAALYYNLGTTRYKAGQMGLAIVAYRQSAELAPRDASLRANLDFVRKKVNGEDKPAVSTWKDWLSLFTLNEGAVLAAASFWVFCLLLALGEWRPALARPLRKYVILSGAGMAILTGCLAAAAYLQFGENTAVVVVKEAVARFGPLDEAKTAFSLPDGSEVQVVDAKDAWLQVKDITGRMGWVKRSQVIHLQGRKIQSQLRIAQPAPAPPLPSLTKPTP
jgi:tetratricopeptide (TPR) repeat protein